MTNEIIQEKIKINADIAYKRKDFVISANNKENLVEELNKIADKEEIIKKGVPALKFECKCGHEYNFERFEDLPEENFICNRCGKFLIIYTGKQTKTAKKRQWQKQKNI